MRALMLSFSLSVCVVSLALAQPPAGTKPAVKAASKDGAAKPAPKAAPKAAVPADPAGADDEGAAAETAIVERFIQVLEKNPRRGTAFDRVYGAYVERGELTKLVDRFTARSKAADDDGTAWMILGLIESQRGRDSAATAAFTEADRKLTGNALSSFYLGQSLLVLGKTEEAIPALERAIARKPAPTDLVEVFQTLGRAYQRSLQPDQAAAVWTRMEEKFPGDLRVQEQIAQALIEEGQSALALPRLEKLAAQTKDKYKQTRFKVQVAELRARAGDKAKALAEFEALLGQLNPDNWLYRDVRRQIDEVFLRSDDQDGLTKYYTAWVEKNPRDVEAIVRLAKVLDGQARGPESRVWLDKALKLAPSRKDLRRALIASYQDEGKTTEVLAQYAELDKLEPNNPDILRDWGRVILRDTSRNLTVEQKRAEAGALWKRLLASRPDDPVVATQVADLFRNAELVDDALGLYRKAVDLAPESAQYREYLGEYLHQLKRSDEALAAWKEMAAGKRATAKNLARLAEVLAGFGYLEPALVAMRDAVKADGKELSLRLQAADLYYRAEKHEESLVEVASAAALATSPEEQEQVLQKEIRALVELERLKAVVEELGRKLDATQSPSAPDLFRYSRLLEADGNAQGALAAIDRCLTVDPKLVPALGARARLLEAGGQLAAAADVNRTLANLDRRYRTEYLTAVSRLEARLGHKDEALQAARDVIASAPGAPEHYESFAQLCFQLGETEQGLDALRRLVRVNPSEPKHLVTLAGALTGQGKTDEAQQLYWQAFEKTPGLDDRLPIVTSLTNAYLQSTQLDKLMERLERMRREAQDPRDLTICLAQMHQAAGDIASARTELEGLFSPETRDTQLLQQLSTLSEADGDGVAAVRYQETLVKVAPGKETETRLVQLLVKEGNVEEAGAWMERLVVANDLAGSLTTLDAMIEAGRTELAARVLSRLLRNDPDNWELLYREASAVASQTPAEAEAKFRRLLALGLGDEPGAREKARGKPKTGTAGGTSRTRGAGSEFKQLSRFQLAPQVAQAIGLGSEEYYGSSVRWSPASYFDARLAAWGWLVKIGRLTGNAALTPESLHKELSGKSDLRSAWDQVYLASIAQDASKRFEAARLVARRNDREGIACCLMSLPTRAMKNNRWYLAGFDTEQDTVPPLPADEVRELVGFYETIRKDESGDLSSSLASIQTNALGAVLMELKRAKLEEELAELKTKAVEGTRSSSDAFDSIGALMQLGDLDGAMEMLRQHAELRLAEAKAGKKPGQQNNNTFYLQYYPNLAMARHVDSDHPEKVLDVLNMVLDVDQNLREAERLAAPVGRSRGSFLPAGRQGNNYVNYFLGKRSNNNWQGMAITFPAVASDLLSTRVLWALMNANKLFESLDRADELNRALEARVATAEGEAKLAAQMARIVLLHWRNQKDEAATALAALSAEHPTNVEMQGLLIGLYEELSRFDDALELVEAYQPEGPTQLLEKNQVVLRLALRAGQTELAREAAEALYGQRLPAQELLTLSSQLRQLGMTQQADAVAARVQRQAGRQTDTLVMLMQQYQADGKPEQAAQIAIQLVRKTKPSGRGRNIRTADDQYRQQALSMLAQLGKLDDLIAKTEKQLEQSPRAVDLMETLASYYQAAGKNEQLQKLEERLIAAKPKDAATRRQIAQRLASSGKHSEACDVYLGLLKEDPKGLMNDSWELMQTFRQAKRAKELADAFEAMDLRQFGTQSYMLTNMIQNMMSASSGEAATVDDPAFRIFRKAWTTMPGQREQLMGAVYQDAYWKLPEMYEMIRAHIIPAESTTSVGTWESVAVSGVMSYQGEGAVDTVLTRLVTGAKSQKKSDALLADLTKALERHPGWEGGRAIQALVLLGLGRKDEARPIIESLAARKDIPGTVAWVLAQEAVKVVGKVPDKDHPWVGTTDRLLAVAVTNSNRDGNEFQYSPQYLQMRFYRQTGRDREARELVVRAASSPSQQQNDPAYSTYRKVSQATDLGRVLTETGGALEAVYFLSNVGDETEIRAHLRQVYGGGDGFEHMITSLKSTQKTAITKVKQDRAGEGLVRVLTEGLGEIKPERTATVLLLTQMSKGTNQGRIGELVEASLSGVATTGEPLAALRKSLDELLARRPDDLALAVIRLLVEHKVSDSEGVKKQAEALAKLLESRPLGAVGESGKLTTVQRQEAELQLPVWLAYLLVSNREGTKELAETFRSRGFEAARRQGTPIWVTQFYRDAGRIALEAGDKAETERLWSQWLDQVTEPARRKDRGKGKSPEKRTGWRRATQRSGVVVSAPERDDERALRTTGAESGESRPVAGGVFGWLPATVLAADPQSPAEDQSYLPLTKTQFEQVMEIALESARAGLTDLSRKALGRAFSGGVPVPDPAPPIDVNRGFRSSQSAVVNETAVLERLVYEKVSRLLELWEAKQVPAEERYAAISRIVLPGEPADVIRLYSVTDAETPASNDGTLTGVVQRLFNSSPQAKRVGKSLGELVARQAVAANKTEDLLAELSRRTTRPEAKVSGLVITVAVAKESGNAELGKTALARLLEQIREKGATQGQLVEATLAGMSGVENEALRTEAIALVEAAAPRIGPVQVVADENNSRSPQEMLAQRALLLVSRYKPKGVDGGNATLESLKTVIQRNANQYTGDSGLARKSRDLKAVAVQLTAIGQTGEAWAMYGEALDIDAVSRYSYGAPVTIRPQLFDAAEKLPAVERYALLKQWTFPTAGRKTLRTTGCLFPSGRSGSSAVTSGDTGASPPGKEQSPGTDCVTTLGALVAAAKEAGQLDDLSGEVLGLVDQKVPGAELLMLLCDLARGAGAAQRTPIGEQQAVIKGLLDKSEGGASDRVPWGHVALVLACLEEPAVSDLGRRLLPGLIEFSLRRSTYPMTAFLRERLAVSQARARKEEAIGPGRDPGLALWIPGGRVSAEWSGGVFAYPEPFWVGTGDAVGHVSGQSRDHLLFKYPLEGTFEFSVDVYMGYWSEGNIGYGGIEVDQLNGGLPVVIHPVSQSESIQRPDVPDRGNDFNTLTVRVTPEAVTYLTNGKEVWTQKDPGRTSPWLMLQTWGTWKSVWKNARLSGTPVIPRKVSLVAGGRLAGWSAQKNQQTVQRELPRSPEGGEEEERDEQVPWWRIEAGRLVSSEMDGTDPQTARPARAVGRLSYLRPLQDGETLRYTFAWREGVGVFPAVGSTAFLFKADGVSTWTIPESMASRNAGGGGERREEVVSKKAVPLSNDKDNVCELSLEADTVKVVVNGEVVVEWPLAAGGDRTFSFVHFPEEQRVDVGEVTLTGNWPESLSAEELAWPFRLVSPDPRNVLAAKAEIIGDAMLAGDPFRVVWQARQMEPAARYEFLKEWVLPGEKTASLRMQGGRTPRDPAPPVAGMAMDRTPRDTGRRRQSGGELVAPVVELVRTAKQLKTLNDLAGIVKALPDTTPLEQRAKRGLFALLAIAQGNTADVLAALKGMSETVAATDVKEPEEARWIELLVALEALESEETRYEAFLLLEQMMSRYRPTWDEYNWTRAVAWARSRAYVMSRGLPPEEADLVASTEWQPVSATRAETRGRGWGQAGWLVSKGEAMHQPGHAEDFLYYLQPLRGDFEVTCDVTTFGYREFSLMYGGKWAMLRYDEKSVEVAALDGWTNTPLPVSIPVQDWYELKLKVSNGEAVWTAAGKEVYRETMGLNPDPWLALHSSPINNGGVRHLRITGQPVVPETVEIAIDERLTKWRPSYFSDSMEQNDGATWRMGEPGEILSARNGDEAARETLLRYHRPSFEDGVFAYEFFHEPGAVAVAPALDRMALVLSNDAVKVHWITDGSFDRTGLAPDNLREEPGLRVGQGALPLKAGDWNRMELVIVGDTVEARLNGEAIARRAIESTNQRHLGLFRFRDWPTARVRKTTYTGKWSRTVPSLSDQELAGPIPETVRTKDEPPLQAVTIDFRQAGLTAEKAGVDILEAPADGRGLTWTQEGLEIEVPPHKGRKWRTAVVPKMTALGDFEYTATFSNLRIQTGKASPGRGVELGVDLLSPLHRALHVGLFTRLRPGLRTVVSTHAFDPLVGDRKYPGREWDVPESISSGRFRLIRKGSEMTSFFAPEKATTWMPLETIPSGKDDVRQFRFQVGQWDETSTIGARLELLEIKAEVLLPRK